MHGLRLRRHVLAAAGAALALGLAACAAPGRTGPTQPFNGGVLTQPLAIPDLALRRADGKLFTTGEARGRWALYFFGYTTCPDVCPMTLAYVSQVRRQLGPAAPDAYFVTVDPARDTPARLAQYMANFDPGIVALTGTDEQLARMREAFGVVAEKRVVEGSGAAYFMDHTALIFLVNPTQHSTCSWSTRTA
jgi:protein SCO1/2